MAYEFFLIRKTQDNEYQGVMLWETHNSLKLFEFLQANCKAPEVVEGIFKGTILKLNDGVNITFKSTKVHGPWGTFKEALTYGMEWPNEFFMVYENGEWSYWRAPTFLIEDTYKVA